MKSVEYAKVRLPAVRSAARAAHIAREAISACCSPEWRAAHEKYRALCEQEHGLVLILAKHARASAEEWASVGERELMARGYF